MFHESLLQSSLWGKFQEINGHTPLYLDDGLVLLETLPVVGKYLYAPRGPIFYESRIKNQESRIRSDILKYAEESKAGWVRVEPGSEEDLSILRVAFSGFTVIPAPHDVQPREILVMNIDADENTLLAQMKSKTRYNIRLAEKHGVKVRFSRTASDIEAFIDLIYATTERKAIRPHPKAYYRNFFTAFDETQCTLALAEHEGQILAANLLVFYEGAVYYLHGGSSDEGRHRMAPYLLQWEGIREAKRRSTSLYDFGGVRTDQLSTVSYQLPANPWAGITRFKLGFAPMTAPTVFPGTYDIILSPWRYKMYMVLSWLWQLRKRVG